MKIKSLITCRSNLVWHDLEHLTSLLVGLPRWQNKRLPMILNRNFWRSGIFEQALFWWGLWVTEYRRVLLLVLCTLATSGTRYWFAGCGRAACPDLRRPPFFPSLVNHQIITLNCAHHTPNHNTTHIRTHSCQRKRREGVLGTSGQPQTARVHGVRASPSVSAHLAAFLRKTSCEEDEAIGGR